jgi:hypothetical protein
MTVARTALRLMVTQAIKGTEPARPTIAEGRVYDSRISPESPDTFSEDAKPVVIVLTDGDEGEALSDQNGGPPFHRRIDLVFDIGMVVQEKAPDDGGDYVVGYPDTDARAEASLDVLQTQIVRFLSASSDPLAIMFQRFVRPWKQESHRQVEDNTSVKLARRLFTMTCEVNDDCYPLLAPGADIPEGLAVLPEPLRTVCALMPPGSAGADTCAAIAQALGPTPFTSGKFGGVDITVDANAGVAPADGHQVKASAETGQT